MCWVTRYSSFLSRLQWSLNLGLKLLENNQIIRYQSFSQSLLKCEELYSCVLFSVAVPGVNSMREYAWRILCYSKPPSFYHEMWTTASCRLLHVAKRKIKKKNWWYNTNTAPKEEILVMKSNRWKAWLTWHLIFT